MLRFITFVAVWSIASFGSAFAQPVITKVIPDFAPSPTTIAIHGIIAGSVAIYFLLTPFGVVIHELGLTPERAAAALLLLVLLAPFQLAFHFLLRRGGTLPAAITCLLGRGVVVAILVLAVRTGVLSGVVLLMLPVLAILFVAFELLSSAIYAASRNHVVAALVEVAWLSWVFAAVLPISW